MIRRYIVSNKICLGNVDAPKSLQLHGIFGDVTSTCFTDRTSVMMFQLTCFKYCSIIVSDVGKTQKLYFSLVCSLALSVIISLPFVPLPAMCSMQYSNLLP